MLTTNEIMTAKGIQFSTTTLDLSPCLRNDFVDEVKVIIDGFYVWGGGYVSSDAQANFTIMVYMFCDMNQIQYTPADPSSAQLSDNETMYAHFHPMEVVFRTTKESETTAKQYAALFAQLMNSIDKYTRIIEVKTR